MFDSLLAECQLTHMKQSEISQLSTVDQDVDEVSTEQGVDGVTIEYRSKASIDTRVHSGCHINTHDS